MVQEWIDDGFRMVTSWLMMVMMVLDGKGLWNTDKWWLVMIRMANNGELLWVSIVDHENDEGVYAKLTASGA